MSHKEFAKWKPTQTLTSRARISLNSLIIFDYEINFLFIYIAILKFSKFNKSTFIQNNVYIIIVCNSLYIIVIIKFIIV